MLTVNPNRNGMPFQCNTWYSLLQSMTPRHPEQGTYRYTKSNRDSGFMQGMPVGPGGYLVEVNGSGHHGPDYVGVASVRNGKASTVSDSDDSHHSDTFFFAGLPHQQPAQPDTCGLKGESRARRGKTRRNILYYKINLDQNQLSLLSIETVVVHVDHVTCFLCAKL